MDPTGMSCQMPPTDGFIPLATTLRQCQCAARSVRVEMALKTPASNLVYATIRAQAKHGEKAAQIPPGKTQPA